ncbi:MAG TPA: hypothetical protein VFM82_03745 [Flavobacteriaceae bacterium]|nr:hypothetical protein [Flavobacteriaceae bacterium]
MKINIIDKIELAFLFTLIIGCTSVSTEDLVAPIPIDEITYTTNIQPIVANNCVLCHSNPPENGAPMPLTSYEFVKDAMETRGLLDRIQRSEGTPGAMPLGGPRLPQTLIDIFEQWKANGMPE